MNPELKIGGIKEDYNPNDFIVAGEPLEIPQNTNTKYFEYNQYTTESDIYKNTRWSCGLFATMGAISDLTGYKFTQEEILEVQRLAIDSYGLEVPGGMYMSKAVDCVRSYWNNKYPDKKLISYKFTIGDNDYENALRKGHSLAVGYKTSTEYAIEQNKGEIVSEDFPKGGGHLVRNVNIKEFSHIRDNYVGIKKFNIYKNEKIIPLCKNRVYYPSAYLFLFDVDQKAQAEKIKMQKINEIMKLIEQDKDKKRIRIYDNIKAYGYDTKYIDYCIRKYFGVNITKEMEI